MRKVIIAGSRNEIITFTQIAEAFYQFGFKRDAITIISGGAKGPDTQAVCFAEHLKLPFELYKADWSNISVSNALIRTRPDGTKYNARAGIDRNHKMGDLADALIAFWDYESSGTKDMIEYMRKLNKPAHIIDCRKGERQ